MLHFERVRAQKLKQMCQDLSTLAKRWGAKNRPLLSLSQRYLEKFHLIWYFSHCTCLLGWRGPAEREHGTTWQALVMGMNGNGQVVDTEEVTNQICEKKEERCQNYSQVWVLTKAAEIKRKEAETIIQTISCIFQLLVIGLFSLGSFIFRSKETY